MPSPRHPADITERSSRSEGTRVRLSDVMAALSTATDLSMGQPVDHALTTCVVAMRLGDALGLGDSQLHDVYYESLLRYIGCNAETAWAASVVGDEIALRAAIAPIDGADIAGIVATVTRVIRESAGGATEEVTARAVARAMEELPAIRSSFFPGHCEVARLLAARLAFPEQFVDTVGQLYARWDGHGVPALAGEAIAPAFLCTALAQDAVVFHRLGGVDAAVSMARARRGGAHSPVMVDVFVQQAERLFAGLDQEPVWEAVQRLEPGEPRLLDDEALDNAFGVLADYGDIKSPWFLNHSHRVADLARRAAEHGGMSRSTTRILCRAALVHDIGKIGVSSGIWSKAGALTDAERRKAQRHTHDTGRIFGRSEALGSIGALAALHHEMLDGSGYHGGLTADMLSPPRGCSRPPTRCNRDASRDRIDRPCRSMRLPRISRDRRMPVGWTRMPCAPCWRWQEVRNRQRRRRPLRSPSASGKW